MKLSIIITALNEDPAELNATIASIRDTAGDAVEVVVVDDMSSTPVAVEDKDTIVIHNRFRCGVGPSRHIGACRASCDWLLITDSHMRFAPGWLDAFEQRDLFCSELVNDNDLDLRTVYCGCCITLNWQNMDLAQAKSRYYGAELNVYGTDRNVAGKMQVFEAVWIPKERWPEDEAAIPVVMGACYFVSQEWFLTLSPCRYLKTWGQDETMLSVKSWLAGGAVRLLRYVEIGHRFQVSEAEFRKMKLAGEAKTVQPRKPFAAPQGHANWNKLFAIHTLWPEGAAKLTELMGNADDAGDVKIALALLRDDWRTVATEMAANERLLKHDFRWFAEKFNIPLP